MVASETANRSGDACPSDVGGRAVHRKRASARRRRRSRRVAPLPGLSSGQPRRPTRRPIMSRRINVNPDHYKVAGRERQGENVVHEVERREANRLRRNDRRGYGGPSAPRRARVQVSVRRRIGAECVFSFVPPSSRRRCAPCASGGGRPFSPDARAPRCDAARRGSRFNLRVAARDRFGDARDRLASRDGSRMPHFASSRPWRSAAARGA